MLVHKLSNILEYMLYSEYFEKTKELQYVGFKKFHPHDSHSIIRIALKEPNEDKVSVYINDCQQRLQVIYQNIQKRFDSLDDDN